MNNFISMRQWVSIDEACEYLSKELNTPFSQSALFDLVLSEKPHLTISIVLHEWNCIEKMPDFVINKYQGIQQLGFDKFIEVLIDKGVIGDLYFFKIKDHLDNLRLDSGLLNAPLDDKPAIDKILPRELIPALVAENGDIYNYPNQAREETEEWHDLQEERRSYTVGVVDVCLFHGSYQELESLKLKANGFNKEAMLLPSPGLLIFDDKHGLCRFLEQHTHYRRIEDGEYVFGDEADGITWENPKFESEIYFDTCYSIKDLDAAQYCFRPKYLIDLVEKIRGKGLYENQLSNIPPLQESQPRTFHEPPQTLKYANAAFVKFWGNANPLERDTHPDNGDISAWVQDESKNTISKTMADKIAQIIRPEWAATGRKPQS